MSYQIEKDGLVELIDDSGDNIRNNSLYSEDLKPVSIAERTWSRRHIASLWAGMSICIPTYTLSSGLITSGMNWREAVFTIFLGNIIVLIPMILIAAAGTKYGISYPVFCRASFGKKGAHLPLLLRAGVACGWFGINCWIGGEFMYIAFAGFSPSLLLYPNAKFVIFILFLLSNLAIAYRGHEAVKAIEVYCVPILVTIGVSIATWAIYQAGSLSALLEAGDRIDLGRPVAARPFKELFLPSLNAMISYWAPLALNISDFTRFASSQKDQALGQLIGLPPAMAFFSMVGVFGTLGSIIAFNQMIWNPVYTVVAFKMPWLSLLGGILVFVAIITTNIAANVVGPSNIFSNLSPKNIPYRYGVLITGFVGLIIMPWKLYAEPTGYIFNWLGTYGSFLGPLTGLYIADYYFIRRQRLSLYDLYSDKSKLYNYRGGVNYIAYISYALSVTPFVLDLCFSTFGGGVVNNSWAFGVLFSFTIYGALMKWYYPDAVPASVPPLAAEETASAET